LDYVNKALKMSSETIRVKKARSEIRGQPPCNTGNTRPKRPAIRFQQTVFDPVSKPPALSVNPQMI
jgi:hypothetical protein